jgi:hypothetical protein
VGRVERLALAIRWTIVAAAIGCAGGVDNTGIGGSFGTAPGASASSDPSSDDSGGSDDSGDSGSAPGEDTSGAASSNGTGESATTSATGECGDGVASGDEPCDGEDFAGQSCADFGFEEGILICNPECDLLTEGCRTCGDGMRSMAEICDGADVGGETCQSQGYGGGTLACATDCNALVTDGCTPLASCGDGTRNGSEQCDGNDLAGSNCESLGFDSGVLSCNAGACTFNTQQCEYLDCGRQGDFCLFDENDPQSTCCPAGVGGNMFGLCAFFVCQ